MLGGSCHIGNKAAFRVPNFQYHQQHVNRPQRQSLHRDRRRQGGAKEKYTVTLRAEESARQLEQEMQSSMENEQNLKVEGAQPKSEKNGDESAAAKACSQAVDGLDKLLSDDEKQPQPLRHRSKALRALDFAGNPYLLFTSALLFIFIAWDVFGSGLSAPLRSFYLLPRYVDWPVHAWVKGTFNPMLRDMAAEKVISNLPIFLGSTGWLACAVTAIAQNPARGSRGVGIAVVGLWAISGVGSGRKDLLVVDILKHIFQRVRPSDINKSFAFPSGHSTSAVFILGTLLFVILPLCVAGPEGDTKGGNLTEKEGRALDRLVERIQDSAVALWVLGGAMTAFGRVFADVHWVSDTLAGACLGVFLTGAAANLGKVLRSKWGNAK